jgi:hypothetical protein
MRLRREPFFVLTLIIALTLISLSASQTTLQAIATEENGVVLPTEGTLDERAFFSTRRDPAVGYDRDSTDVVGDLSRKVADGTVKLRFEKTSGYLRSVLEALEIPIESQTVLFSKTSLQSHYISPSNPRALFYTDEVSVGFIRNAPLLEIAAFDPRQGVIFYAMEQSEADRPVIARSDSCLSCHESRNTLSVPGILLRSMGVGPGGQTMPQFGNYVSDHRSPFIERWGGWFVTGNTGSVRHMGNVTLAPNGKPRETVASTKLTSLEGKFDLEGYPTAYSDVAAVLVFNHQSRMTNLLTRVGWEARIALDQMNQDPRQTAAAERLIAADAAELVDYMLFVDEVPLPGKLESTSGFAARFAAIGPRDKRGRTLRQVDLGKRLMRYPCSYMIYSRAFEELPGAAKDAIYARLWSILSGQEKAARYSKLSNADRADIVTILLETKDGLPSYYRPLKN